MASRIGVVLVGIGGYGANYVSWMEPIEAAGEAAVRAVIDPLADRSPAWPTLAARGVPRFASFEAFEQAGIPAQLAAIASPIAFHADHACSALAAGMHVMCEKPLCAELADVDRMIAARDRAGRMLGIGYQWSYSEAVQALKADILAGRLGAPIELRTRVLWPRPASYFARNRWAGRVRDDQGRAVFDSPVNNATAHYLHNMLYVLGPAVHRSATPLAVTGEVYRANPIENFDAACCRIETDAGAPLLFFSAHCVDQHENPILDYRFEAAAVTLDETGNLTARYKDGAVTDYGNPNADGARKLRLAIAWAADGTPDRDLCGVEAAMMHTRCVDALQRMPVRAFDPGQVGRTTDDKGDTLTYMPELAGAMIQGFEAGRLFSELELPWAASATPIVMRS